MRDKMMCFAGNCESKPSNPKAEETATAANGSSVEGALRQLTWYLNILTLTLLPILVGHCLAVPKNIDPSLGLLRVSP